MTSQGARGRRFEGELTPEAVDLNASVDFDKRLLPEDVAGSIAHARMLGRQGIISAEDAERIASGLEEVKRRFERGELSWDPALEDVHMNVEARLTESIGDAGSRLHTGRSRNDQISTDLRLYSRNSAEKLSALIGDLRRALLDRAERYVDAFMPGYTHLQRAQPIRVGHHFLAYDAMLRRDQGRLADAARRAGECPLGAGALAATTYPIDREGVAADLGFEGVTRNSLDAAGDRDFAVELVAAIALCQTHLSRLGEEIVLWVSQEFSFATLGEGYCSGSSIMPQKVNPDVAELIRGKTGRVTGHWVSLMTVLKGLPLAYNKDLQETQEPLFDAVDTLKTSLLVARGMVESLEMNTERLRRAVGEGYLVATELADYLVTKGRPFRRAHDAAGALVRRAQAEGLELEELSLEALRAEDSAFGEDIYEWLDVANAVDRRDVVGGPARARILAEIERSRRELNGS